MATLRICAYIDQQKKPILDPARLELDQTEMETVPYLDLRAQYLPLRTEVLRVLEEICESTTFAQGPATSKFEAEFAAYCGVDHCVSLNSGTSGCGYHNTLQLGEH